MSTIKQLERRLETQTPWGPSELDQRTRRLREAGILPSAGRGRHAPDLCAADIATILLSLAAPLAVSAVATAKALAAIPCADGRVLLDVLTEILNDADELSRVAEIRIFKSWPRAEILRADGSVVVFEQPDARSYPGFEMVVLRASLLSLLAAPATTSGWTSWKPEAAE